MGKTLSILIIGGTGIIGRELSRVLVEQSHDVYVVSRGAKRVLSGATPIIGDAYNFDQMSDKFKNLSFDVVIDLVSFNPVQLEQVLRLIGGKCKQYIFISSATVYADAGEGKITEESPKILTGWNYPLAKIACENYLRETTQRTGQTYTIVRPYITYSEQRMSFGVWEIHDVLQRLRDGAPIVIGNEVGHARTTLTHSADLALGIAALAGNESAYGEDFNVTSDESITWGEVYSLSANFFSKSVSDVDVSSEDMIANFPELSGKISDRLVNRTFDNSKLYRACPDLKMKVSVRSGYKKSLMLYSDSVQRHSVLITQGRIDRLVARRANDKETIKTFSQHRNKIKKGLSLKNKLLYCAGYYVSWSIPFLRKLKDAARRGKYDGYAA